MNIARMVDFSPVAGREYFSADGPPEGGGPRRPGRPRDLAREEAGDRSWERGFVGDLPEGYLRGLSLQALRDSIGYVAQLAGAANRLMWHLPASGPLVRLGSWATDLEDELHAELERKERPSSILDLDE